MIIGTAGHIDHGKTALVKALTGVDADRLAEEKARGITIDLGFAYQRLSSGEVLGFVDVPGHERFIHNMLAGASGIDFVILVIAADDGPMPQTREHLAILDLLGVRRGIVALSKCDLADRSRRAELRVEIEALLSGTGFAGIDILEVSALTGEGVDALGARLAAEAASHRRRAPDGRFRLAVDRCFTIAGAGTVVTGTVFGGSIAVGDAVAVVPSGLEARVRSLRVQQQQAERGGAGQRCALNLTGPKVGKDAIRRGDWVTAVPAQAATDRLDGTLLLLASEAQPLRHWTPVHLHLAAAHVPARVALLRDEPIRPGSGGLVQLVLDQPIGALWGDRFVLRDASAQRTIGGGQVLDPAPPRRRRRTPERLAILAALSDPDLDRAIGGLLDLAPGLVDLDAFARDRNLTADELEALVRRLSLLRLPGGTRTFAVAPATWARIRDEVRTTLTAFHAANPDQPGLPPDRLRLALPTRLPAEPFPAVLQALQKLGVVTVEGSRARLPSHTVQLVPADQRLWERIEPLLRKEGFRPPRVRDLAALFGAPEQQVRRLMKLMARAGKVEEVAHDHFFLTQIVATMARIAAEIAAGSPSGEIGAAAFRDRLDNGRKVAIQILEYFDQRGLTVRKGDLRTIRADRLGEFVGGRASATQGGESSPVGRPDFKSVGGRPAVSGGFDSHSLPPSARSGR